MRKVALSEEDCKTGTASVVLHTCPRRGELVEGPSYTLILSVSQLEEGANLWKNHRENPRSSLMDVEAPRSPQRRLSTEASSEAAFSRAPFQRNGAPGGDTYLK